jgi:tetratricopeptide (TPR) repeat protein
MTDEQLQEISPEAPPTVEELLLQLEELKQSENIPDYISLLEHLLQLISCENEPATWAVLQFACGNALQQSQEGDKKVRLERAVDCYDAALTVYTHEHIVANWIAVQQYRRSALSDLAELQQGAERLKTLETLIACCDAVLTVCTREATPTNWAVAFYHKAMALYERVETLRGDECFNVLQEAVCCYDAALTVYTREDAPIE